MHNLDVGLRFSPPSNSVNSDAFFGVSSEFDEIFRWIFKVLVGSLGTDIKCTEGIRGPTIVKSIVVIIRVGVETLLPSPVTKVISIEIVLALEHSRESASLFVSNP